MALSPGMRHKQQVQAQLGAAQAATTGQATGLVADSLHLQLIALEQDLGPRLGLYNDANLLSSPL